MRSRDGRIGVIPANRKLGDRYRVRGSRIVGHPEIICDVTGELLAATPSVVIVRSPAGYPIEFAAERVTYMRRAT
jgi:hypothetical protein